MFKPKKNRGTRARATDEQQQQDEDEEPQYEGATTCMFWCTTPHLGSAPWRSGSSSSNAPEKLYDIRTQHTHDL